MILLFSQFAPLVYEKTLDDGSTEFYGFEAKLSNLSFSLCHIATKYDEIPKVNLMEAVGRSSNFVPSFRRPTDGLMWGDWVTANATFNGMLGDLQHGRTDVGMDNLYIRTDSAVFIDFSGPYNFDAYCFLVPMPETKLETNSRSENK